MLRRTGVAVTLRQLADLGPEWKRLRDAAQRQALAQREARAQAEASTTLARDQARSR